MMFQEAKKSSNGKAPHTAWCNYDDLNEYFWFVLINIKILCKRVGYRSYLGYLNLVNILKMILF
jgi:hypothetical protein